MKFNFFILIGTVFSVLLYFVFGVIFFLSTGESPFAQSLTETINNQLLISFCVLFSGIVLAVIVNPNKNEKKQKPQEIDNTFCNISHEMLFLPSDFDTRLKNTFEELKKVTNYKAIYVCSYQSNQINVLDQNSDDLDFIVDKIINPNASNLQQSHDNFSSQQELLASFYNNDKKYQIETLGFKNKTFHTMLISFNAQNSAQAFGSMCLILPEHVTFSHSLQNHLMFLAEAISFSINIAHKKDSLLQANMKSFMKFNEIDDELKIYNHKKIEKTILSEAERYKRYLTPLSLVLFSIDDIDKISDKLSSQEMLSLKLDFTKLIRQNIRSTDTFGSWEDNVYAIVVSNVDYQGSYILATHLMKFISTHDFYRISNLTCSFGITSYTTKDTQSLFVKRASSALEKAKLKDGNSSEIQLLV